MAAAASSCSSLLVVAAGVDGRETWAATGLVWAGVVAACCRWRSPLLPPPTTQCYCCCRRCLVVCLRGHQAPAEAPRVHCVRAFKPSAVLWTRCAAPPGTLFLRWRLRHALQRPWFSSA